MSKDKKTKIYTAEQASVNDMRFTLLKSNLDFIATQYPRLKVLYPMQDTTAYQDFETLIAVTIEDAEAANDND